MRPTRTERPRASVAAGAIATALALALILVPAGPALAAPFSDTFNRADSTDLGAGWVESGTSLAISASQVTNPNQDFSMAMAVGGTGDTVAASVFAGTASTSFAALLLRGTNANDGVFIRVADTTPADGQQGFTEVSFLSGNSPAASTIAPAQTLTPFASARMTVGSSGSTLIVAFDTDFDDVADQTLTVTITSAALGTGVGFALSGGTRLDDFRSAGPLPVLLTPSAEPAASTRGTGSFTVAASSTGGLVVGDVLLEIPGEPDQLVTLDGSGDASFSLANLPVGATSYVATLPASAAYVGVRIAGSIVISQAATSVTVSVTPAFSTPGQAITLTADVIGATGLTPTGTVSFFDGATLLAGGVPIVGGAALVTVSSLAGGQHTITAVYSGDADHLGATSLAVIHRVGAATGGGQLAASGPDAGGVQLTLATGCSLLVLGMLLLILSAYRDAVRARIEAVSTASESLLR